MTIHVLSALLTYDVALCGRPRGPEAMQEPGGQNAFDSDAAESRLYATAEVARGHGSDSFRGIRKRAAPAGTSRWDRAHYSAWLEPRSVT